MNTFEDRLLLALRSVVDANPAPTTAPVRRSLRRPVLAGTAVVGVAAGATSLLVAGGTSAAYAVDPHSDGSITVTINSLRDASGLQAKLQAAGVKAVVDYLPTGKACRQPRYQPASAAEQEAGIQLDVVRGGATTFTLGKNQVSADDTLVIETSGGGDGPSSIGVGVAAGAVGECQVVDAPVPGPPGSDGSGPQLSTRR